MRLETHFPPQLLPYDYYIIHGSYDKSLACLVCDELQERGLKVFVDVRELPGKDVAPETMARMVRESTVAVILVSQFLFAGSQQLYAEVFAALEDGGCKIFPVFMQNRAVSYESLSTCLNYNPLPGTENSTPRRKLTDMVYYSLVAFPKLQVSWLKRMESDQGSDEVLHIATSLIRCYGQNIATNIDTHTPLHVNIVNQLMKNSSFPKSIAEVGKAHRIIINPSQDQDGILDDEADQIEDSDTIPELSIELKDMTERGLLKALRLVCKRSVTTITLKNLNKVSLAWLQNAMCMIKKCQSLRVLHLETRTASSLATVRDDLVKDKTLDREEVAREKRTQSSSSLSLSNQCYAMDLRGLSKIRTLYIPHVMVNIMHLPLSLEELHCFLLSRSGEDESVLPPNLKHLHVYSSGLSDRFLPVDETLRVLGVFSGVLEASTGLTKLAVHTLLPLQLSGLSPIPSSITEVDLTDCPLLTADELSTLRGNCLSSGRPEATIIAPAHLQ